MCKSNHSTTSLLPVEFTILSACSRFPEYSIGAGRLVDGRMRQACSHFEVRGAWQRSRFAGERRSIFKTKKIWRKNCLVWKVLWIMVERCFFLNANGSRNRYSPLKPGPPAPRSPQPLINTVYRLGRFPFTKRAQLVRLVLFLSLRKATGTQRKRVFSNLHVVDEWQRHLVHVGALVRQESAPLLAPRDDASRVHDCQDRRVRKRGV